MSRIFDALQRSERERSGANSTALPDGPELLKQAERYAASTWSDAAAAAVEESPNVAGSDLHVLLKNGMTLVDAPASVESAKPETPALDRQRDIFKEFPSLPVSISNHSRLVCLTDRESPTAEAVRLLGVRLKDFRRTKPLKKVLITSTIPQEGKSTVAANLACVLSYSSQQRTLLVEGDLRRPSLSAMFGVSSVPGICESLRGDISFERSIYRLENAGLWIWPAGHAPGNPLELLQSPKLPTLMDQLAANFDWIIIDSPPVLPLADTSIWMRLADGVLLVTRQGTTEKRQLQKGLEALDRKKLLGALLNGAVAPAYSHYYYLTSDQS
jgi:capsular exopolysaccharide synthesis family protein